MSEPRPSAGARALLVFLKRHGLTMKEAGEAIGVSAVAMWHWSHGERTPRLAFRNALEVWTRGQVRASSWGLNDKERSAARVRPFGA